jgi:methylthioribose-1-phosphate isomerase
VKETDSSDTFSPLRWTGEFLQLLDQTRLPECEVWLDCRRPQEVAEAIERLAVRGAPAIGVATAYGLVLGLRGVADPRRQRRCFEATVELLASTRPTAVNLRWALDRGREVFESAQEKAAEDVSVRLLQWARDLQAADVAANRRIGAHGAELFAAADRVLTHCNTGALATAGFGTALGVVTACWRQGKLELVWVDETRPLLQGARLTAWELGRLGIPYRLITDSSAGSLMARGKVDRVVVGADRIAANGDVANKIGTYPLAVLADYHGVPFYVAAPLSTIDRRTPNGEAIPIEERQPSEVTRLFGTLVAPEGAAALNLAFDVTPEKLVSGIVTEVGVLGPPYTESIARAFGDGE